MMRGAPVVRVSLRSSEGQIGDHGRIEHVFADPAGVVFGLNIIWEREPGMARYVSLVRVQPLAEWERERKERENA